MTKIRPFLQIAIIACLLLTAVNGFGGTRMPSFTLPDVVSGKDINSSVFEGKTLFVTFFATWCPPCMEEVPTLIKLQKKYAGDGFTVVGLSVDQGGAKVVKKLVKKKSINYPVVLADAITMQSFGGVYGIPVSFLVNKKGDVVKKYTGYVPISVLEKDLRKIL